jgi:carbonic anhydrase/acetyltransferase-like protein (isoleucine patch superfamily)
MYSMPDPIIEKVSMAAGQSELHQAVAQLRADGGFAFALGPTKVRSLTGEEIRGMESQGNTAEDWSRIGVAEDFDWTRVLHSDFQGSVILGRFSGQIQVAEEAEIPCGIYRSTLANCVIGHDSLIRDVRLLANCVIGPRAVLFDCGSISAGPRTTFGNGASISLGIESGGREVAIFAEIDVEVAAAVARRRSCRDFLESYSKAVCDYVAGVVSSRGIIESGAIVRHTPQIRNAYLGRNVQVDSATLVSDSTVLSNAEEPTRISSGACVTDSILQWGSRVESMAIVYRSVLTEHSHAERHAKVTASIIGPNSGVGGGEVIASLVGPFVGFHHQALLIAALWPEGKGNIGYGANVGSNHTSKAPDQEIWPGEGTFQGLGVNIKYPSDLSRAPYTVVACGVSTLPQKVTFPFSLIQSPSARISSVSPAYNEILPAWALAHNLYALKRNEWKYRARNRARRMKLDFNVFRPEIIKLMRHACHRLESVNEMKEVYTSREIKGLGKNFMLEATRQSAIEAYRFFIALDALNGLLEQVRAGIGNRHVPCAVPLTTAHGVCLPPYEPEDDNSLSRLLVTPTEDSCWEQQRRTLVEDFEMMNVRSALIRMAEMTEIVAEDIERSKSKDDQRGSQIIDDYADAHIRADQDPFILQTWQETRRLQSELNDLIARLPIEPEKLQPDVLFA